MRATKVIIDGDALLHNIAQINRLSPHSKIIAVVKANAYGHGLEQISQLLKNKVDAFGVACIEEALLLRQAGITQRIILLEGLFEASEMKCVEKYDLEVVVHSQYQLDCLAAYSGQKKISVWLKLDSGMHRLGFSPKQFLDAHELLCRYHQIKQPIGLMTHFSDADDPFNSSTQIQHRLFKKLCQNLKGKKTEANSAAVLAWPETHGDYIRPGLLIFGCSPLIGKIGTDQGLKPVMTLESQLIAINNVSQGESIGYGSTSVTTKETDIGVVAIGYGDGYPRHAKVGTPIWINDRLAPLVGRVSMDMISVDLGKNGIEKIGDRVVLWGPELPVETIAEYSDTISYELLCGISRRVSFQYKTLNQEAEIKLQ